MPAEISPRDVAEAKVEMVAERLWRVGAARYWLRHDAAWSIWPLGGAYFPSESAARAALLAAQERAGVYPRPAGATCGCIDLLLSVDVRKSQMVSGWPDNGIWHPVNYDEYDRRYVWAYRERCRLCSRGVPLPGIPDLNCQVCDQLDCTCEPAAPAPAAPGGEGIARDLNGNPFPDRSVMPPTVTIYAAELAALRRAVGEGDTADPNYKPPESDLNCDCEPPSPAPYCNECGDRLPQYEVIPAAELAALRTPSCPCEFPEIEPCGNHCTCRHGGASGGCRRCCRYGSREQQLAKARMLAKQEKDGRATDAALLASQERAGVYARPEKATCGCVMMVETVHLDAIPEWLLSPRDRRWCWRYSPACRLCSRGVPLHSPAALAEVLAAADELSSSHVRDLSASHRRLRNALAALRAAGEEK